MSDSPVGERLSEAPHTDMVSLVYAPRIEDELKAGLSHMTRVNEAHVVMLARREILDQRAAAKILSAVREIEAAGPEGLKIDPSREDLYYNYERAVMDRAGPDTGGRMHTGRSRNDLGATIMRMKTREILLALMEALLALREALLDRSGREAETVMPGYTHLQPAQPITLGHYLAALEGALSRDWTRLYSAYSCTDACPLGAGALAGTGYPIDRELAGRLLGFERILENTLDCVAARDYLLELLSAGTLLGTTLSRLSQDLYVWYTDEFRLVDFRDRVSGTSSIMPQKKNPVLLESVRGKTAHVLGALTASVAGTRNTSYSNLIDAGREAHVPAWPALEELRASVVLTRLAVENLLVDPVGLLERCRANYSTVTDLADALVSGWGISFRQAHEVVGAVVREAVSRRARATDITADMVSRAAERVLGRKLRLDPGVLGRALDPVEGVRARSHPGGPAPQEVRRSLEARRDVLKGHAETLKGAAARLERAQKDLDREVDLILKAAGGSP